MRLSPSKTVYALHLRRNMPENSAGSYLTFDHSTHKIDCVHLEELIGKALKRLAKTLLLDCRCCGRTRALAVAALPYLLDVVASAYGRRR